MFHPWAGRIRYAMAKNVNFVIENPSSTLLWRYVTLVGNWEGLRQLRRTLRKERRCHLRRVRSFLKIQTVVRWRNAKGESKCVARILKTQEMQTIRPDDEVLFRDGAAESKKARQAEPKGRGKSAAGAEAEQPNPGAGNKQSKGDPKGSGKSAWAEERPNPKGSGKQSQGELKGSGKSAEERPNPNKGSGKQSKGELKGSGKSAAGAEEQPNPNKGSGKQSKGKGEGSGKSVQAEEHPTPTPKGSGGKQSKGKGEPKGSSKSAGPVPEEHPTPKGSGKDSEGKGKLKGSGKQSKGTGERKGSGKSTGPEEHPKGSGKQSGSLDQKVELRNLNPESMRRFFNSETYAKGSGDKGEKGAGPAEEHPKGSGKPSQGKGDLKGSGKSAGPEEHTPKGPAEEHPTPKGSGKQSKGKGELKGSGKTVPEEHHTPKGSGGPEEHPKGSGAGGKSATRALLKAVHQEAADLCNTQHEHDEHQHWQYSIHDMTNRGEIHDSDFRNPLVILPTCVLGELSNMQAKQPRLCQERLRGITEHQPMFEMFKNWQAQHYQNHTTAWGKAPAAQIMQHNKFLAEVLLQGMEPSTEIEADGSPGEEGEEELQEEPEEEEDDPEDDAEQGDEDEWRDDEGWDEAEEGEGADQGDGTGDDDDDEGIPTSGYPDDPDAPEPPAAAFASKKPILRAPSSISVASLASKSSSISPVGVRNEEGKVRVLDEATRQKIQEMTHPNQMDAGERRRQREAMRRFEFLKAFMLDPDMTNMYIETVYSETSEKRNEGHYIELPLHELQEKYEKTEEGRRFLREDILAKQSGREHPQAKGNPAWRLYKVYQHGKEISANVSKVGTKTTAKKNVGKADAATKKKLGEILTSQAADFVKGTEVLTEEEIKKRDFDKTMQQILALAGKARTAAQSLKRSGMERQEAWIHVKLYLNGFKTLQVIL
ncbi:unnamed protein product [Symbiodinium sp. KB8]|nr:unnamed protein product [Symbiodinium sp. KB8]